MTARPRIRIRGGSPHCPLCRVGFAGTVAAYVCEACRTRYHDDCARELGGCSTLGCRRLGVGPEAPTPDDQRWRARARRYASGARARRADAPRLRQEHVERAQAEGTDVDVYLRGCLNVLDCLSLLMILGCALLALRLVL